MKIKSLKLLFLLPLVILLLSGCAEISNDAIKNALNNEENCLKGCDEMEDKAMAEYEQCKKEALDWYNNQLEICTNLNCLPAAMQGYQKMLAKCDDEYKKKLVGVRQCRKDCRAKFPLEIKLK